MNKDKFNPQTFEEKWRAKWTENKIYNTPANAKPENKYYILPQLPYPSGSGLHMGHSEIYIACDILARYKRMVGNDVLQVIGWDAFGLPAENYAIKTNVHPRVNTDEAIDNFRKQIKDLGVSVDWNREVGSHNQDYYKWTQWFFLLMYKQGLAYREKQTVNWCPHDKTVLANEQVEPDGTCERCGNEIELKEMDQWYLKITEYADRLYDDLDKVDWPEETVKRQRDWIGRKTGINIKYDIDNVDFTITCFTTRPDTNFGATFIVCAPDGDFIQNNIKQFPNRKEVQSYANEAAKKTELERQQDGKKKTGVFTGLYAINNLNKKKMPIYTSDFVLSGFGTGNVVGVPGHDMRDFEFAKAMKNIEIIRVVVGADGDTSDITDASQVQEENGTMINSDFLDGKEIHEATIEIMDYMEEKDYGEKTTTYRLRDWSVSRQRFWGAPIPIVYDPEGNPHPIQEDDLPVILPDDVDFKPTGQSPLTYSPSFQKGVEERYGKGWTRELDTLDTFMCSSWYFFRYIDPHNNEAFASKENLKNWMPVDFYLGGPEHVNGHLLYSRFFTKVLFDAGIINFDEPFPVHRHQGIVKGPDGRKMSKRWGNVINPTDVVEKYGADTIRTYMMFMGPLEQDKAWNDNAVQGVQRFYTKVWNLQNLVDNSFESEEQEIEVNKLIKKVTDDIEPLSFNTAIAKMMEFTNFLQKEEKINTSVWERFLQVLAPFGPFIVEELWHQLGNEFSIHQQNWPKYNEEYLVEEKIEIGVQINGKLRSSILTSSDALEKDVLAVAMEDKTIKKYVQGPPKKVIYVPGRILSIIT